MKMKSEHSGDIGIALLVGTALGWDIFGHETISSAVRRHTEHPGYKLLMTGFMGALTLHFLDLWPEGYDPFKLSLENAKQATI